MGTRTVEVLQLDRREALAHGYRKTFRRLSDLIGQALEQELPPEDLCARLRETDDHGLSGWCFTGTGQEFAPFCDLRARYPDLWAECRATLAPAIPAP
jgi:hypothetical protein